MTTATIELARDDLRWLQRFATVLARDADEAEDLVQDTLLQAWKTAPRSDETSGSGSLRPWLATVLRNRFRNARRGRDRRERREQATVTTRATAAPDTEHARLEVLRLLLTEIGALSDVDQKIIVRRFLEDESAVEVGRALGMPTATVRTRTHRSMKRLRESLDRRYGDRKTWCAAVLAVPLPGAATATNTVAKGSRTMSTTVTIAAITAATLGAVGWFATDPGPAESQEPAIAAAADEEPEPVAETPKAPQTPQEQWQARRDHIEGTLGGSVLPRPPFLPPAPAERPKRKFEELVDDCLSDLGSTALGTITVAAREIGAPDIGTIYDAIEIAHTNIADAELRQCVVQGMHAYVGPAPDEAFERNVTKMIRVGKATDAEAMYGQLVSRIIGANINTFRECNELVPEGVTATVELEMVSEGEDHFASVTPSETELPTLAVECLEDASLGLLLPRTGGERRVVRHEFSMPIAGPKSKVTAG